MFKKIRIAILMLILFIVGANTYLTHYRAVSWDKPLWVAVYPINPDKDPTIERYIESLSNRSFEDIESFFQEEAEHFGLAQKQPFDVHLAHRVEELPPAPPVERSTLSIMWWSLKLRYWVYTHDHADFSPHIRVFVVYHNYTKEQRLAHSLGLEKGMIGVVHAYAHRELQGKNNLVIAHELLHTLGATDKYDLASGQPIYPDGYASPDQSPRYPQQYAELMGGATPISEHKAIMPRSLAGVVIGHKTAVEINWPSP